MESTDSNRSFQKTIEARVLNGLDSFFGNPNNFDRIVLAAKCRIEKFSQKLNDIADKLIRIDTTLKGLQKKTNSILKKVSTGEISEEAGSVMLSFNENLEHELQEEQAELQLQETILGKQIRAMDRFEDLGFWCNLYPRNLSFREKTDLLKLMVERVDIYIKMP